LPFGIGRFWGIPIPGAEAAWFFGNLHKTYGPIYEWKVFGVTHIWIETDKIARDLLVQRGKKYGDRHELPAALGVRGGSEILPLMGIGENFWRHKNFIHTIMRYSSQEQFWGFPAEENRRTLKRMLNKPEHWSEHLVTHCARIAGNSEGTPMRGARTQQKTQSFAPNPKPDIYTFVQFINIASPEPHHLQTSRHPADTHASVRQQDAVRSDLASGTRHPPL
jgi:hypothetical protein